jgi:2-polyprenyl-3-methyl-5-hydroxy-6-metoxy-1,4-benzoquinol methylase
MDSLDKNEIKEENNINENKIEEEENKEKEKEEEEIYEEGHYPKKEYEYVHDFEWNDELEKEAIEIIKENNENVESLEEFLDIQNKNWEKFYKFNKTNFFKDRHYILEEFNELKNDKREKITLLDMGCGVGNSFYPLIVRVPNLYINAFDFSKRAINMSKTHPLYEKEKHRINVYDLDLVKDDIPNKNNDYGILMFVLSAIKPEEHEKVVEKISKVINKGGILYFRDYARYDMAQIRFAKRKKNKVGDNLYMRKDKTLSYFFDKNEIENLFKKYGFSIVNSNLICRLIENRKEKKKMHRLWLQIKFKKE